MRALKKFFKNYTVTILIIVLVVLGYGYLTGNGIINTLVFPTLDKIGASFAEFFWPTMIINMLASFSILFPAILIGTVLGIIGGVLLGYYRQVEITLGPIVSAASVIPSILLAPIALQFAPNFTIAMVGMIVYNFIWPILIGTMDGIKTIDKLYLDTCETLELKGLKRLFKVVLPAAMPNILSGFTVSLLLSFVMLAMVEMYGADHGMGQFMKYYTQLGIYSNVWSGFIFMIVVLVAIKVVYECIQRYLLRWTL